MSVNVFPAHRLSKTAANNNNKGCSQQQPNVGYFTLDTMAANFCYAWMTYFEIFLRTNTASINPLGCIRRHAENCKEKYTKSIRTVEQLTWKLHLGRIALKKGKELKNFSLASSVALIRLNAINMSLNGCWNKYCLSICASWTCVHLVVCPLSAANARCRRIVLQCSGWYSLCVPSGDNLYFLHCADMANTRKESNEREKNLNRKKIHIELWFLCKVSLEAAH